MTPPSRRDRRWVVVFGAAFAAAALLLPFAGPFAISLERVFAGEEPDFSILTYLRVSRTLLGLFAGGALALSGALFQAMLRDALATPYTLGVSAGASLGAVVAIWADWQQLAGVPAVWLAALIGAAIVLAVVSAAAADRRGMATFTLLLAGLAANSVAGVSKSFSITRWLIGSIDSTDYASLSAFVAVVALAAMVIVRQANAWNLVAVHPTWAATRGVRVGRMTWTGYGAGSVLTAATVALTGPIGFVGLVVPHVIRTRIAADHRVLMPCAFFGGGVLLAACDALGRVVIAPAELPAGAIMALIGGPYLVWVLRQRGTR